jgi:integrase
MPTVKLTDRTVQNSQGPAEIWDANLPNFGLRIGSPNERWPKGRKTWQAMYRINGGPKKRLKLGNYPEMPLAKARTEAKDRLSLAQSGIDPKDLRQDQQDQAAFTVAKLCGEYIEKYAKRRNRRWYDKEKQLKLYVLPLWGKRPASAITTRDVSRFIDGLENIGPATARSVYATVRHMFGWAADRQQIDSNPCTIGSPAAPKSRDRVLTANEIKHIWDNLGGYPSGPLFKLLFVTGQREGNVAQMEWDELDLENALWTIPAEKFKANREHVVPLSKLAMTILSDVPRFDGPYVFSGQKENETPFSGFSKAKARLDEASGVTDWRLHDIRRTVATQMQALGIAPHIIEAVEGRISGTFGGPAGIYQRHPYVNEKRDALSRWARKLAEITA